MSGSDDGPGRREVAHRLFAAEFEDVSVSYRESDEERAPNYVVLPTGARVNRAFAVGVLTEVESVNEEVVRARIADPTGAFVSYAGQYQPEALAFFERTTPPTVVSLTGKARTFEPEDGDRVFSSLRPESVNEVDGDTRDRWIVDAARATLRRVAVLADALSREARGDDLRAQLAAEGVPESLAAGVPLAIERYGVTEAYLEDVRRMAVEALEVVAGERDSVTALSTRPDEGGPTEIGPVPDEVAFEQSADAPAAAAPSESAAETTGVETDAETVEAVEETTTADETDTTSEASDEPGSDADESPEPGPGPGVADEAGSDAPPEPTAEDGQTPEPAAEPPSDPEPVDGTASDAEAASEAEPESAAEPEPEPEPESTSDDDIGDFETDEFDDDGLYEMDDEERAEAEEFGTEFETGSEVGPAGEADIDVPEEPPEPDSDPEGEPDSDAETADDATSESDEEADADVDLEDAAVAAMEALDDGDGADREAVVARVVEDHGADPDAVDEAIQDALMSGRCYEPDEATLKPI